MVGIHAILVGSLRKCSFAAADWENGRIAGDVGVWGVFVMYRMSQTDTSPS